MTDIETMIEDAERHGRDSEPDHEVGDLQALARVLWQSLPTEARDRVAAEWRAWDAEDAPDAITKVCVKCDALIRKPVLAASEPERCRACGDFDDADRMVFPLEDVYEILAEYDHCCTGCAGWDVFDTSRGLAIQRCDECNTLVPRSLVLDDADVAQLPEAQEALERARKVAEAVAAMDSDLPGCPKCGHRLRLCSDNDPACAHCDHCDWCGDPS